MARDHRRLAAIVSADVVGYSLLMGRDEGAVALADFNAAVPGVDTIPAIKKWMHPVADLAGYEPFYEGLRLAGVAD